MARREDGEGCDRLRGPEAGRPGESVKGGPGGPRRATYLTVAHGRVGFRRGMLKGSASARAADWAGPEPTIASRGSYSDSMALWYEDVR